MIKSILVPVRGDGMVATVLAHAAELAKKHNAQVDVVHCRAQAHDLMPPGLSLNEFARKVMMEQAAELANRQEDHLRGILRRLSRDFGLTDRAQSLMASRPALFPKKKGAWPRLLKQAGRLADLDCFAKTTAGAQPWPKLFESSTVWRWTPVLVCPGQLQPDETFAEHVAIGWNGSLPASRAVASSFDIVRSRQTRQHRHGWEAPTARPDRRRTDKATTQRAASLPRSSNLGARTPQKLFLRPARTSEASLLVVGAYSHSHETEMLFGGNTGRIVDNTEMPILMAH